MENLKDYQKLKYKKVQFYVAFTAEFHWTETFN